MRTEILKVDRKWRFFGIMGLLIFGLQADASLTMGLQETIQSGEATTLPRGLASIEDSIGGDSDASFNLVPNTVAEFSDSFSIDLDQSQDLARRVRNPGGPPSVAPRGANSETYAQMNRLIGSDTHQLEGLTPGNSVVTFGKDHPGLTKSNAIKNGANGSSGIDEIAFGIPVAAAPEAAEWAMLLVGAVILGVTARQRATAV